VWMGEEIIMPLCDKDEQVVTKYKVILKRLAKLINESPQSCQKV